MIKDWFTNSKIEQTHPTEEDMLRCVDGELSAKEAAQVRSHLETCWNCRLQSEKLEATISNFVDFRQQIQIPLTPKPPKNWDDFNNKLKQLALETPSAPKNLFGIFGGFGKYFRSLSSFSDWSPIWKQTAISAVAVILISTIFWQFVFVSKVSANELLDKASQLRVRKISEVNQAVVYQKLRVSRENSSGMNWELWRDTSRSRFRQQVSDEGTTRINNELWQILQENGFNPQDPLSALTFANWRKTLSAKTDTVESAVTEDGKNLLILQTVNLRADSAGKISSGILTLRAEDFHPVEQVLRITTSDGVETYNFKELDFQVVSLNTLKPDFFPDSVEPQLTVAQVKESPSPSVEVSPELSPSPTPNLVAQNNNTDKPLKTVEVTRVTASTDLEVDVLNLLNQAKADLGEQITVTRSSDGLLYIRGIVETDNRKNEIYLVLQSVRNNPAVRIDLKTVDEAVADQENKAKQNKSPGVQLETREIEGNSFPAEDEVRAFFAKQGGGDEAVRQYAAKTVSRSNQAMRYLYALKRITTQFTPAKLKEASPEAREKWLSVIKSHARSYQNEIVALRRELQPIFGAGGEGNTEPINTDTEIFTAIERMFAAGAGSDKTIKAAFTTSDAKGGNNLRSAQFWNNLRQAESLARSLQAVK